MRRASPSCRLQCETRSLSLVKVSQRSRSRGWLDLLPLPLPLPRLHATCHMSQGHNWPASETGAIVRKGEGSGEDRENCPTCCTSLSANDSGKKNELLARLSLLICKSSDHSRESLSVACGRPLAAACVANCIGFLSLFNVDFMHV